jgi:hypothetical protein
VDLFQVPDRGSKAWVRAMLYDAAFSPGGTLVRLQRAVSIVRGASVPDADWERVRSVWEQAAGRMSEVTGTAFRVVQQPEPGTVVYSVEQLILSLRRRLAQTAFEDDVRNALRASSGPSSGSASCAR